MKNLRCLHIIALLFLWIAGLGIVGAQQAQSPPPTDMERQIESLSARFDRIEKLVDDVLWYNKVGDVALIDKVYITGPPKAKKPNPTAMGVDNPVKFWTYVFIPHKIDRSKKYPLLVFPHGGVHGDFSTYHAHMVREIVAQGYIIVAPEYRGSTGYGRSFMELIDYGALENDDVYASRNYMIENYDFVDKDRIGILGWSHGGMISLMNVFEYPDAYKAAYAGVPVSDLVARMGYATDDYRRLFSAQYHIGKTARDNIEEYRKRSPVNHAEKLKTPLLIHTTTNDDDVNVLEVEHLIRALKAAGKKFEYEIFKDAPGGHSLERIDIKSAREIRLKVYRFLGTYLKPPMPFKSLDDLVKAGYR